MRPRPHHHLNEETGKLRVLTESIEAGGRRVGTFIVADPLSSVDEALEELRNTFLVVGALTLALAVAVAIWLAGLITARCGASLASRPRWTPATSRTGSTTPARTRWASSRRPSTTCSTGSRPDSAASASSSPTPPTSCAARFGAARPDRAARPARRR